MRGWDVTQSIVRGAERLPLDLPFPRRSLARPRLETSGPGRRELLLGAAVAGGMLVSCTRLVSDAPTAWHGTRRVVRDFDDPFLELGRQLKEAAEVEHDLMVQYLYAAFSLKPAYAPIIGEAAPVSDTLLGVAVQEMQHLRAVNQLLVELGFAPVLTRHDFPEEIDLYPFPFSLEPLSRKSLAKYVYCEAPPTALQATSARDAAFVEAVKKSLGPDVRPNHVGSLYDSIIDLVREVAEHRDNPLKSPDSWLAELQRIKDEGEHDHYLFFRSLFMGEHELLVRRAGGWTLGRGEMHYPARDIPTDPTAYDGYPTSIADPVARRLAWIGNLAYLTCLAALDAAYQEGSRDLAALAQDLMRGPMLAIARKLPDLGVGLPFDPLSLGFAPGRDGAANLAFARRLARETLSRARDSESQLPTDFDLDLLAHAQERLSRAGRPSSRRATDSSASPV